ncbi:hypothetical protein MKX03_002563 [Papaver bracteatum]|nr:hypothetical protein MKX03_002563 [Papaver bracteatum]
MQRRESEDLPHSGKDSVISTLCETLRAQGLGIPAGYIQPSRFIVNTVSRDQPTPARHSSGDEKLQRKSAEGDENKNMCPICQEDIKDEKGTAAWPNCSHRFHLLCISKWMKKKQNCPICRSEISPEIRQSQ